MGAGPPVVEAPNSGQSDGDEVPAGLTRPQPQARKRKQRGDKRNRNYTTTSGGSSHRPRPRPASPKCQNCHTADATTRCGGSGGCKLHFCAKCYGQQGEPTCRNCVEQEAAKAAQKAQTEKDQSGSASGKSGNKKSQQRNQKRTHSDGGTSPGDRRSTKRRRKELPVCVSCDKKCTRQDPTCVQCKSHVHGGPKCYSGDLCLLCKAKKDKAHAARQEPCPVCKKAFNDLKHAKKCLDCKRYTHKICESRRYGCTACKLAAAEKDFLQLRFLANNKDSKVWPQTLLRSCLKHVAGVTFPHSVELISPDDVKDVLNKKKGRRARMTKPKFTEIHIPGTDGHFGGLYLGKEGTVYYDSLTEKHPGTETALKLCGFPDPTAEVVALTSDLAGYGLGSGLTCAEATVNILLYALANGDAPHQVPPSAVWNRCFPTRVLPVRSSSRRGSGEWRRKPSKGWSVET